MKNVLLIFFIFFIYKEGFTWGWEVHRFINQQAVDYLSTQIPFFTQNREYLTEHSVDPDIDDLPGYYHYIDIDNYPEFFSGTLPHQWSDFLNLYGESTAENNGIVPWVINWWTDSLAVLIANENWPDAIQVAAELGHYVGDSHNPLHLTKNYNGQYSGNNGIHSRYESYLVTDHLEEITFQVDTVRYWINPLDSVFSYIDFLYPFVDSILIADDSASSADGSYGSLYYQVMWQYLENLTIIALRSAAQDLASLWLTAWRNGTNVSNVDRKKAIIPDMINIDKLYPNPFNSSITIEFSLLQADEITIRIYDISGKIVERINPVFFEAGYHCIKLQCKLMSSGIYFLNLSSNSTGAASRKIILLK